ncbi:hypothetical protein [Vogesella indigofera]|uniref:hypothetical protein n=1 Tax=Vogesella indigofera TaxID=45465 RepID=UPI003F43DDF2
MKPRALAVAVTLSGLLLGGCASPLANKTADAAAIHTIEQNARLARYNFDGEVRVKAIRLPGKVESLVEGDVVSEVAKSFSLELRGAVDMSKSRVEMTPTFRFSRPNAETWLRLPMLAELNTLTLWVDASVLDLAFPVLRGEHKGKYVMFQAPQDKVKKLPIDAVLAELPQVAKNIYAAVDSKAYTFQPLDEAARKVGASYRIRLTLDPLAEAKMSKQAVQELLQLARRHAGEHQKEVEEFATAVGPLLDASQEELQTSSQTDLLVSRSGKLLGISELREFSVPKEKELAVTVASTVRLSNHEQPVFSMQPTANNVVSFTELQPPSWLGGKRSSDDEEEAVEGDDEAPLDEAALAAEAAEEAAAAAAVVKKPAKAAKAAKPVAKRKPKPVARAQ